MTQRDERRSPVRSRPGRPAAGFTLIELLVTIAIAAILLGVAAPSFKQFQRNSQLTSTVNSLVAAVGAARAEAMKQQLDVYVTPNSSAWANGWSVWVDTTLTHSRSSGVEILNQAAIPSTVSVSSGAGFKTNAGIGGDYIKFNGAGFPQTFDSQPLGATQLLVFTNGTESRNVMISSTGRIRACKPDTASCNLTNDW